MSALSAVYFSVETYLDAALFVLVSHPAAFTVNSIGGTSMERPLVKQLKLSLYSSIRPRSFDCK